MELFDAIKKIIVSELALDEEAVVPEAHLQDDLGGDSLMLMSVAEAIAEEYKIELQSDELVDTADVGELVKLVESKIASKS
jgi:acyl carrier protein